MSAGFSLHLNTVWNHLDKIYSCHIQTFNEKLQCTPRIHGAFDNHQQILPKKNVSEGKSAITQIGTAII